MCREIVAIYNPSTDELFAGVGHHTDLFTKHGVTNREGWIKVQSDLAKGPGNYHVENGARMDGKTMERITDFYRKLTSSPDAIAAFVREHGMHRSMLSILSRDAQRTYNSMRDALSVAYQQLSNPVTVRIDNGNLSGTITVHPNVDDNMKAKVIDKPLAEVFCSLLSNGLNRSNAWKSMGN